MEKKRLYPCSGGGVTVGGDRGYGGEVVIVTGHAKLHRYGRRKVHTSGAGRDGR